jgi:hypothetical protein
MRSPHAMSLLNREERMSTHEKKAYITPQLTVYGTIQEITTQQNKKYGTSDGYAFMGQAITNYS